MLENIEFAVNRNIDVKINVNNEYDFPAIVNINNYVPFIVRNNN